jgi:predicted NBD/HSP70 family sugar kinase
MGKYIGVLATDHLAVGLVEDSKLLGAVRSYPADRTQASVASMPAESLAQQIREQVKAAAGDAIVDAIGVGFPGIIRDGIVEDSPNLQQVKGFNLQAALSEALRHDGGPSPAFVFNDADVMAAGVAATREQLHKLVRVWNLGNGIGFGRYPSAEGVWEGGHSVVTLDPKENYCGCGGKGHLEGIMGHRAMRLRFLDMEPDEVFEAAAQGDTRCAEFVELWHRALAAASATSIHLDGPGKFFVTGHNARFLDLRRLDNFVHEMVKMSPLQGSSFEVITTSDEVGVIGAAVNAERGLRPRTS